MPPPFQDVETTRAGKVTCPRNCSKSVGQERPACRPPSSQPMLCTLDRTMRELVGLCVPAQCLLHRRLFWSTHKPHTDLGYLQDSRSLASKGTQNMTWERIEGFIAPSASTLLQCCFPRNPSHLIPHPSLCWPLCLPQTWKLLAFPHLPQRHQALLSIRASPPACSTWDAFPSILSQLKP